MDSKSRLRLRALTTTILGGALAAILSGPAIAADVTQSRLENADAEPQNWLMGFQDFGAHRYSRLDQINRDNIADLRVAFTIPLSTGLIGRTSVNMQNYPLVDDGVMYVDDGAGQFVRIDLAGGNKGVVVWRADSAVPKDIGARSRGITMMNNAIFHNLADGRVVSIDRDSGEFIWDVQIARVANPEAQTDVNLIKETFTAAPIATDGRILVANSGGDAGTRGWLASVDAATGEEQWRTYVIPGPGEAGHETWQDTNQAWKTGGGGMWTTGSYDPAQRVTIWGTGQPQPMFDPEFRPGDNLFTNSAIAFDIETGDMKWYFQYTANENWDYDEQGVHMLIDAPFGGVERQMVAHFGRNGHYYQLDRTNGEFISAAPYVEKITWTAGIDPKTGHPVEYDPNLTVQQYIPETRFLRGEVNNGPACPDLAGGVRWQPPAYNPEKQMAYAAGIDGCFSLDLIPVIALPDGGIDFAGPGGGFGAIFGGNTTVRRFDHHGIIAAVDVTTGQLVVRHRQQYENLSGVLATAGGLIFSATLDGAVTAHNDETLDEVWRFNTGISIKAPPISYALGDTQYIAVVAGGPTPSAALYPELGTMTSTGVLYVFALGGGA